MQVVGGLKDNELFSEIHRTGSHCCETSGLFEGLDTQHDSVIPRAASRERSFHLLVCWTQEMCLPVLVSFCLLSHSLSL